MRDLHKLTEVTIADMAAASGSFSVPPGYAVVAVDVDASWTTADLGFQICTDGSSTFVDIYAGVGTTTARARCTGVPATAAFVLVPQAVLNYMPVGGLMKITSINAASNADLTQTGAVNARIWIARAE